MGGQVGLEDALEQRLEGDAATALHGKLHEVVVVGGPARVGDGVGVGTEPAGDVVGDAGVDVGGAVATASERQPGRRLGACFLGLQSAELGFVGDVGGEVVQQAAAQVAQLAGAELAGLLQQVGLGLGQQAVTQIWRAASPAPRRSRAPARG